MSFPVKQFSAGKDFFPPSGAALQQALEDAPVFERLLEALEQQHSTGQPVLISSACRVLLHHTLQLLPLDRANITRLEDTVNKFLQRISGGALRFTLTAVAETTVSRRNGPGRDGPGRNGPPTSWRKWAGKCCPNEFRFLRLLV